MASSSTGQDSVSLSDLRDKYTEYSRLIDIENSKIKRDSPRELRQAILENILNLKREQVDIQLRINQLKKIQGRVLDLFVMYGRVRDC